MKSALNTAERQFISSRLFDVSRELVFRAFTDPDHLKRWWGPKGYTLTLDEFDPRPGGVWRFVTHGPDGAHYRHEHLFVEVVKPERIVLQDVSDQQFQLTVLITEETGKTRLTWCKSYDTIEECGAGTTCAVKANEQHFDRLAEQLAIMAVRRPFVLSRIIDAPRDLVWKAWTDRDHIQWWGPKGTKLLHARYNFRPDGIFHYCMRGTDGRDMWGRWVIREIIELEQLEFAISISDEAAGITRHPLNANWPLEVLSTVLFAEHEGKTRLTVRWIPLNATEAERETFDASYESMRRGWTGTLNRLVDHLSSLAGS
jgi:uncharacterized protein YndB with AHSA1/START domain